jgi:uncharacterized protein (TIGR03000 family)
MAFAVLVGPAPAQQGHGNRGQHHSGQGYHYGQYHSGRYGGAGYYHYPYYAGYYHHYPRYNVSYGYFFPSYSYYVPSYSYYPSTVTYVPSPSSVVLDSSVPRTTTSFYGGTSVEADKVLLRIVMPTPDAQLAIQNQFMLTTGRERTFISPPMDRSTTYTYTLRATWTDGVKGMVREKKIDVQTGREYLIDFNIEDAVPIPAPPPSGSKPQQQ